MSQSAAVLAACLLAAGCASTALESARSDFYAGRLAEAEKTLSEVQFAKENQVLVLMERGTVRQAAGDYERSSKDYITAADRLKELETYSVGHGAASMVVNDMVQDFRGVPFERTLLHDMTALNHFALGAWDNGAVESRRIIRSLSPDYRGDYPEDGFSRYVAGFGLEMIDDRSNAELQYRLANALLSLAAIDERTGRIALRPPGTNDPPGEESSAWPNPQPPGPWQTELCCFILMGRAPNYNASSIYGLDQGRYAEIYCNNILLGRSYTLADVATLARITAQKEALRKAAKTAAREAIKHGIAEAVDSATDDSGLGALIGFLLFLFEQPDERYWGTLPSLLQVARVPCPPNLTNFIIVVRNERGRELLRQRIDRPITRKGNTFVSVWRDLPTPPPAPEPRTAPVAPGS